MIHFDCDYCKGAYPLILERIGQINQEPQTPYGEDPYSEQARYWIKQASACPSAEVHFLVGGTQTNTTVIASILRPHQGVVAAETGHVNVHESGAIENTGHKVLTVASSDGKLKASQIEKIFQDHWQDVNHEHMVQPGMVYVSQPTELGTLYSLIELEEISRVCHQHHLPLYLDGARLGYALASHENTASLADLARLCDVFYIGGTKVGALFGEAVVFPNTSLAHDFRYLIKQRGGLLAKGWLLGLQFQTLFDPAFTQEKTSEILYYQISKQTLDFAYTLKKAFTNKGFSFLYNSPTNQQFPILPNLYMKKLSLNFSFGFWQKVGEENTAVRFCTHWGTTEEEVQLLLKSL